MFVARRNEIENQYNTQIEMSFMRIRCVITSLLLNTLFAKLSSSLVIL